MTNEEIANVNVVMYPIGKYSQRGSLYINGVHIPMVQSYDIHFDLNSKLYEVTIKMLAKVEIYTKFDEDSVRTLEEENN